MYLCEEYMLRHSIKIPYAKLVNFGATFYKMDEYSPWNILTINWKEPNRHPGNFHVRMIEPRHNGYDTGELLTVMEKHDIYLDEYEDFFFEWVTNFYGKVAREKEIYIAAWEIYLYCHDSLLVKYARMEELLETIDQDASLEERLKAINQTILKLNDIHPRIIEDWTLNMRKYIDHYNHWLPTLMDCMNESVDY